MTLSLARFSPFGTFEIANSRANGRDELPLIRIYPPFDFVDFPDEQELVPTTMDGPYTRLTEADYDEKLREMGNYLWELEQELLTADTREDETTARQVHEKISNLAAKADRFFGVPGKHQLLAAYVAGLGMRMIGEWAGASDRFLNVLKLSPTNAEAWLELSWCLAETEHWEECEMAARSGTEFFPETGAVWGNLALALEKLGRTTEALTTVQTALRLDPQDARSQELLARLETGNADIDDIAESAGNAGNR